MMRSTEGGALFGKRLPATSYQSPSSMAKNIPMRSLQTIDSHLTHADMGAGLEINVKKGLGLSLDFGRYRHRDMMQPFLSPHHKD